MKNTEIANPLIDDFIGSRDDPTRAVDCLDRNDFARRVATGLLSWSSSESLIAALYGQWGSGKTWLLHRIIESLEEDSGFRICRFEPWHFGSNEQILAEFFDIVLQELDKPSSSEVKEMSEERARLWEILAVATVTGQVGMAASATFGLDGSESMIPLLGSLGKLFRKGQEAAQREGGKYSLADLRSKLVDSFEEEDCPKILVVIDDLDRLANDQIQMIFRLLKTTVNLPKLYFLILGERRQLANALDEISGNDGDRYLEKIVQVPIVIPEPEEEKLFNRLMEGLDSIAKSCGYDLSAQSARLSSLWMSFLKERLSNLRSIHRLLSITGFHAACLTRDGVMEVDLLDLLGVDFLRLFAPKTYEAIAQEPPTESWCLVEGMKSNRSNEDRTDSERSLKILNESELGPETALAVILHLFPEFDSTVSSSVRRSFGYSNDHRKFMRSGGATRISFDESIRLYLQLGVDASRLPFSAYQRFLRIEDEVEAVRLLDEWGKNGWRRNFVERLNLDESYWNRSESSFPVLLAMSSVSDDFEDDGINSELHKAENVCSKLLGRIPPDVRLQAVQKLVEKSRGVSIPLLFIEHMREQNNCKFFEGSKPSEPVPEASRDEIESLAETLFGFTRKRFFQRRFPVDEKQGSRFFRLAHALGPKRVEEILRSEPDGDTEATWAIAIAVARNLFARFNSDLLDASAVAENTSFSVVSSLIEFASPEFWLEFIEKSSDQPDLDAAQTTILEHIRLGVPVWKREADTSQRG
tara:strand:- start:547 stop:2811 length:2265 start_codon:yes stop_codon:yes gene_type:complete